jgi:hypothetical protein
MNIVKVFFAFDEIDRFNAWENKQDVCRDGKPANPERGEVFYGLKQRGGNGGAVALFEFEEATVMIAVAVMLHGFNRQVELFIEQFLNSFFGGKRHCKR